MHSQPQALNDELNSQFAHSQGEEAFEMFREPEKEQSQIDAKSWFDVNEYFSKFDKIMINEKVSTYYE